LNSPAIRKGGQDSPAIRRWLEFSPCPGKVCQSTLRQKANQTHTHRQWRATLTRQQCHHHHHLQDQRANRGALQCPASWTKSSTPGWTSLTRWGWGLQGSFTILLTLPFLGTTTQGIKPKATPIRAPPMSPTYRGPTTAIWCQVAIADTQNMCTSPRSTKASTGEQTKRLQDTEDITIFCCPNTSNE